MRTVIFDLDGTLTKGDTYLPFLCLCLREFGFRRWSLVALPYYVLFYLGGRITNSQLKEAFLSEVLSGISLEQLQSVSEEFVSALLKKNMNEQLTHALHCHLKENDRVILATASLDIYVREIAKRLSIHEVACTLVETREGLITGRIVGSNCHGIEKVRRLEELLGPSELQAAVFYTDHHSDLPLLKRVRQGFLVNPCLRTRFLLRNYGFRLFSLSDDSGMPASKA